jgi:hypothetical protein
MAPRKVKSRAQAQKAPRAPVSVFEPGEKRLVLDEILWRASLDEGELEGVLPGKPVSFPGSSARVLGWTVTVSSPEKEVMFKHGVGYAKTARFAFPCAFPRPAAPVTPEVSFLGPEDSTFAVLGKVTVFYKDF